MAPIKKDDVYLYSRHSGRIEVYQGCVRPYIRDKARFTFKRCGKDAYLQCPLDPGVVHHNVVWLFENDIQKAKELFIEHELMAIRDLNDKIKRHEWNIELLQEYTESEEDD